MCRDRGDGGFPAGDGAGEAGVGLNIGGEGEECSVSFEGGDVGG